jgi:hypothetical protein
MRTAQLIPLALPVLVAVGCCSIKSTYVERDKGLCGWKTTHLEGIPTTLEVPHDFKISIIDTYYEKAGNMLRDPRGNMPPGAPVSPIPPAPQPAANLPLLRTRGVEVVVENTKEIFTVDFVRPAAGTLSTKAALDADHQYFTSIDNKIEDKTIQDITTSINTLSAAINPLLKTRALAATDPTTADPTILKHPRVVAVTYVEIADPHAREKIHDFLCEHLNGCGHCAPTPLSPALAVSAPTKSSTDADSGGTSEPAHR